MDFRYVQFKGCGACKLNGCCKKFRKKVKISFTKSEFADNWGKKVRVFNAGETIIAEAVIKENTVYCITGKSKYYYGYEDFIGLNHIIIRKIYTIRRRY